MFNAGVTEGQSTTRPPLFDGTNYSYWKERMRIFIQSNDYKLWLIVKNGCGVPMKKVGEVNVPKTEEEFTDEDCKKMELNAKAINMIYCGVNADDYRKISRCETAKQMWEKLEVTYEGTAQVREAKIDHLTHEYELFSMKENEKIEEMFERFSNIINPLNLLGKTYTDRELVRKVLRSLSPKWRSKVDAIEEGRDFQTTTYDALRGNLITYETTQLSKVVEERNKRSIALPATTSTHNNVDDEVDDSDDTDLGLFVRKFKKMMLKKGAKKNTPPKCYGCGEIGHIKPMCPKLKNEKDKRAPKKQRAYIAWENDGSGSEDSETEEVANLCLMAIEDGDTSKESYIRNSSLHLLVGLLAIITIDINSDLGGTAAALSVVGTGPLVGLGGIAEGGPDAVEILRPSFKLAVGGEDDEADIDVAEYLSMDNSLPRFRRVDFLFSYCNFLVLSSLICCCCFSAAIVGGMNRPRPNLGVLPASLSILSDDECVSVGRIYSE
ncbi:unnamed protein product [Cuscuta campestris]|uniref:CCHC-type domain-containing protein n=1 Tax=Cuscuta campestris TaxID=132261 RepID=A0A484MM40_9ASTE|nr:unnamed protein product [Cuscuta campestris]